MFDKRHTRWKDKLIPLYGQRETENMWRWYQEAARSEELFELDLEKLQNYYPIQYLTGHTFFYDLKFLVNKHTLIPRPETEELVYQVLADHKEKTRLRVIDLGTGSGCIAITLQKHRPDWSVAGIDFSPETLHMARKNADLHDVHIHWKVDNILELPQNFLAEYDIVVSNPPYIRPHEKSSLDLNLDYEPESALFTRDADGLEFYEAIQLRSRYLREGASIYLEMNHHTSKHIAELFSHSGYHEIRIIKDLQGLNRILKVTI